MNRLVEDFEIERSVSEDSAKVFVTNSRYADARESIKCLVDNMDFQFENARKEFKAKGFREKFKFSW